MRLMIKTIFIPTRPQADTLVAIYILKKYGEARFPGVSDAEVAVNPNPPTETEEALEQEGIILFDLGGGRFDHHQRTPATTCSQLVADFLEVGDDPSLGKLLEYAYRDDTQGKGIISTDPIDRALGLSGLITALNKKYPTHANYIADLILRLLEAHHDEESKKFQDFPNEITKLQTEGKFSEITVKQRDKKLRVAFTESDMMGLPGYLRSQLGGRYDLIVQRLSSGHVNILTRPTKRPDLRPLAAAVRSREFQATHNTMILLPDRILSQPGKIAEVSNWYFDPATNSLQNGGANPGSTEATKIPWSEFATIVSQGMSQ